MVAPECSPQQNQGTPEAQIQNLPAVASLDDYLAEGSNDASYMYVSSGPNDPFMIDSLWFAPCGYPVAIYFPGGGHRHHPPPTSAVAATPPRTEGMYTVVASAAPSDPMESSHVGGFDSGIRGFGGGHMSGGRR